MFPKTTFLITVDFDSLYTRIPIGEAIQCIKELFQKYPIPQADLIIALLNLILHLDVIEFYGEFYLQISGLGMGTSLAPTLANIFVGWLEMQHNIPTDPKAILYSRLIDDILVIWNGDMKSAKAFTKRIGTMRTSLTIKEKISTIEIDYLDLHIYKGQRFIDQSILDLKVYQKPTNLYLYVAFDSDIPQHVKKGIIKTELIRYCRICSDELSFEEIKSFFYSRLRDRGYPIEFLDHEFQKVKYKDRTLYLQPSNKESDKCIFFKVMFDSRIDKLNLSKLFRECNDDAFCQQFCKDTLQVPPKICYKKGKSLTKMLVKAKCNPV